MIANPECLLDCFPDLPCAREVIEKYIEKGVCPNAITPATILLEEQGISIWTQAPQAAAAICTFGPKFEPFPASNAADVCSVECFPPSLKAFSAAGRVTKIPPGHVSTISTKTGTRKYSESPARVVVEICDIHRTCCQTSSTGRGLENGNDRKNGQTDVYTSTSILGNCAKEVLNHILILGLIT